MIVEDDDEDVPEVVQPELKNKGKGKATTASPMTNGKAPSRAKGKGRVASTTHGQKNGPDLVVIEELDDDEPHVAKPPPPTTGEPRAGSPVLVEDGEIIEPQGLGKLERIGEERDLVRLPLTPKVVAGLMNTVVQYKAKSEELSETLLRLIQTRKTEPEDRLAEMKAQYEASSRGA